MPKLLCFGMGYVANYLSLLAESNNFTVYGTSRKKNKNNIIIFSQDNLLSAEILSNMSHILISIPPVNGEDIVIKHHLTHLKNNKYLKWVGYISSTAIYGNHNGKWVGEDSNASPIDERGTNRLYVEKLWLNSDLPIHIFRLSAIYGPGRSVFEKIISGQERIIIKENQYFSRMYIKDIASTIFSSMLNPQPKEIYNLADDYPCSHSEVINYACKLLKVDPPIAENFVEANLSPMVKSFYSSSRKISNHKIKTNLGVELKYPSYREGLEEIYCKYYREKELFL